MRGEDAENEQTEDDAFNSLFEMRLARAGEVAIIKSDTFNSLFEIASPMHSNRNLSSAILSILYLRCAHGITKLAYYNNMLFQFSI